MNSLTSTKKAASFVGFDDTGQTLESSYKHLLVGIVLTVKQAFSKVYHIEYTEFTLSTPQLRMEFPTFITMSYTSL